MTPSDLNAAPNDEIDLRQLAATLQRHWQLIAKVAGGTLLLSTIYAFLQAPHQRDLDHFYRRLHELLAPGGLMYVLEPTIRTGKLGRPLGIGGRLARPIAGLHFDRDIPQSIRRAGLFVSDLHRFEIAAVAAPFRSFVEAWARFPTPAPEAGDVS